MSLRTRTLLAAALGLGMAQALPAQEPARLALPPTPSQRIADTIAANLRQSSHLRGYTVEVTVRDGTADLDGRVADPTQRAEVLRIARDVPGVERVRDRLILAGAVAQDQNHTPTLPAPTPVPANPPAAPDVPAIVPGGPVVPGAPPAAAVPGYPPTVPGGPGVQTDPVPVFASTASPYDLNPPKMPPYAWPTYAPYNNYSRVAYPNLYPYNAWPFIGPIYPFPKIPPGWRKIQLEWQDGYWWYSTHSNSHDWWRLRYW